MIMVVLFWDPQHSIPKVNSTSLKEELTQLQKIKSQLWSTRSLKAKSELTFSYFLDSDVPVTAGNASLDGKVLQLAVY